MDALLLIGRAVEVQKYSYSPYSGFCVGAALLGKSGKIYTGCNVENAAYGPSNCAERTAFFKAVSEGEKEFEAIAVIGSSLGHTSKEYCMPCGVCRQVMAEFCDPDFQILAAKSRTDYRVFTLEQLLPESFHLSPVRGQE